MTAVRPEVGARRARGALVRLLLLLLSGLSCAATASEPVPEGCFATVDELPTPADDRLRGDRVVVVVKSTRRAMLFGGGALRNDRAGGAPSCWPIALGITDDGAYAAGPKRKRGDRKAPEGWYRTSDRPWSRYHGAITLFYPNQQDADLALAESRIDKATHTRITTAVSAGKLPPQDTVLGSELLLHGGGSSSDWTWGCVAFDDAHIDELRAALPAGMVTDVLILP